MLVPFSSSAARCACSGAYCERPLKFTAVSVNFCVEDCAFAAGEGVAPRSAPTVQRKPKEIKPRSRREAVLIRLIVTDSEAIPLFDGYGLRQVSRLIHIAT